MGVITEEEWFYNELESLNKYELMALLRDFAETKSSFKDLVEYVDNWSRHS